MVSLSHWESQAVDIQQDLLIVGSGITGLCTAIEYKELYPKARIRVLERGTFPNGASTKNAGFACLGSPTELLDDLKKRSETEVQETLTMRYEGLKRLFSHVPKEHCDYEACGGFELFRSEDIQNWHLVKEEVERLNDLYYKATNERSAIVLHDQSERFPSIIGIGALRLEGALNPWKLVQGLISKARSLGVEIWNDITVNDFHESSETVHVSTSIGTMRSSRLILCTNGLTQELIGSIDLLPARAQVLVAKSTSPIPFKGTFHLEEGYYYFRHLDEHHLLLGGGRQKDLKGETTVEMSTSELIQNDLELLLKQVILPLQDFKIVKRWSGIMGVGSGKKPLIRRSSERVGYAVRLGGMGVAIGAEVAHRAARLWS